MLYVSNELALAIGAYPALIYDFVVRWIYSNAQNNRKTAFVDGKWWTYNTLEYYAGCFSGFMSVRTFQNSVKFLAKKDFLKVKHKGHGRTELWFTLGNNIPNVIPEALPFNGRYVILCDAGDAPNNSFNAGDAPNNSFNAGDAPNNSFNAGDAPNNSFNAGDAPNNSFNAGDAPNNSFNAGDAPNNSFNAGDAPNNSFNAGDAPNNSFNAKIASFNAGAALKDADAPSNGAASEAPKQLNKQLNKNNNNIKVSKSLKTSKKETNKNTLTPMSGIIDTLLGELKSSSVVVVDNNLSDVLGIDFNDPSTHDKIVALGVSLNVEQETMANLIKKYGLPAVAKQLVNLNYQQKVSPASNPAGWIVTAVARNYALNQQALECVKTQKQKQKEREEYNAMVAQMQLEDEERKQREHEEFLKNGPDFDTIDEEFLGFWLCHDKSGFIEKKYRAFLTGKGIPEDQHDAIIAEKRNIRNKKSCL